MTEHPINCSNPTCSRTLSGTQRFYCSRQCQIADRNLDGKLAVGFRVGMDALRDIQRDARRDGYGDDLSGFLYDSVYV
jgi:hypothetical protein